MVHIVIAVTDTEIEGFWKYIFIHILVSSGNYFVYFNIQTNGALFTYIDATKSLVMYQ